MGRASPQLAARCGSCRPADDLITGGLCPWASAPLPGSSAWPGGRPHPPTPTPHPAPSNLQPSMGKFRRAGGSHQAWERRGGGHGVRPGWIHPGLDSGDSLPAWPVPAPEEGILGVAIAGILADKAPGPGAGGFVCLRPPSLPGAPTRLILSEP